MIEVSFMLFNAVEQSHLSYFASISYLLALASMIAAVTEYIDFLSHYNSLSDKRNHITNYLPYFDSSLPAGYLTALDL